MTSGRASDEGLRMARQWLDRDPDPDTRAQLTRLVTDRAPELHELFDGRLGFGTAGLRGPLGPGPNRMNRLVVQQTTAGLLQWLGEAPLVVIGYDARHQSDQFAFDVAGVVAAAGGRAELLPRPLPTPTLAHAVLLRRADAGVMITASHNPPADNGYKLYLGDGIQLVSPADVEIAAAIDAVAPHPVAVASPDHPAIEVLDDTVVDAHLDAAVAACVLPDEARYRDVRLVATALHGVGGEPLRRAADRAGFPPPVPVAEQDEPDPDFPTVEFPNPEEPGALDQALALAERLRADGPVDGLVANDPDADRLALAVPSRDGDRLVPLSGDQLGVLLADHLLRFTSGSDRLTACSLVSSRLLAKMAAEAGIEHVTTLTGFKWVARPIVDRPDRRYLLGYEEALGYCVGPRVRDKDGISAALVAAEMLAVLKSEGQTVWGRLDRLAVAHGAHLSGPVTVRFAGPDGNQRRTELMEELVADPVSTVAGADLVEHHDLATWGVLPPTAGAFMLYDDETRVIVRPSGTEPKLKAYVEVIEPVDDGDAAATWARAGRRLEACQAELRARLGGRSG